MREAPYVVTMLQTSAPLTSLGYRFHEYSIHGSHLVPDICKKTISTAEYLYNRQPQNPTPLIEINLID